MVAIFPITNKGGGDCIAFPNVCMTPGVAAGAPGPLPYPSMADLADFTGTSKVKIQGNDVLRKGDKASKSKGDEAGNSPGGVTSGVRGSQCELMSGWGKVKADGQMVGHQVCVVGQNGMGGKNIPVGMVASVSKDKVKVGVDMGMGDVMNTLLKCDDPPAPPPPTEEELEAAKNSAAAKGTPPAPDPATQQKIQDKYDQVMSGNQPPPPNISTDRMQAAMEGVNGQRIPLTFPGQVGMTGAELFGKFQSELARALTAGGVTDATVNAIGSGTSVFSANPAKNLKPWSPASDCDLSVFSNQAVAQAEAQNVAYNKKYGIYKNGGNDTQDGFSDTPVGKKLQALALRWTMILYGDATQDGVEFKLNTTTADPGGKLDSITAVSPPY